MQPFQKLEAGEAGHLQIEKDDLRERVLFAVTIFALARQIANRRPGITDMRSTADAGCAGTHVRPDRHRVDHLLRAKKSSPRSFWNITVHPGLCI
jgi:hypothetical protein